MVPVTGNPCPICFDPTDNRPDHGSTRLRCGHVFGRSCIVRWGTERRICPICQQASFPHDLTEAADGRGNRSELSVIAPMCFLILMGIVCVDNGLPYGPENHPANCMVTIIVLIILGAIVLPI